MKLFIGMILGWLLASWYMNPMYGCERCEYIQNWAENESYRISSEIYDIETDSPLFFYYMGIEQTLDYVIQQAKSQK